MGIGVAAMHKVKHGEHSCGMAVDDHQKLAVKQYLSKASSSSSTEIVALGERL